MAQRALPGAPFPPEPFPDPEFDPAVRNPAGFRILTDENPAQETADKTILVMRSDDPSNPTHKAYRLLRPNDPGRIVYHQGVERGVLHDCQVLKRVNATTFQETPRLVKIKIFFRRVVDPMLQEGHPENAHNEISILQNYGDDEHIVGCIEALRDRHYLYLVMPLLTGGSLDGCIPRGQGFIAIGYDPRQLILRMASNLAFIHHLHIVFRDFSVEQVLLQNSENNFTCVFTDFAMALRQTTIEGRPQQIATDQPPAGKLPYMPPEIALQLPFGPSADVWCLGGAVFYSATGLHLYDTPGDQSFEYFVVQGGLATENDAFSLLVEETLMAIEGGEQHPLVLRIQALRRLKPSIRDLLVKMMKFDPDERMRIDDIASHPWFQEPHPF